MVLVETGLFGTWQSFAPIHEPAGGRAGLAGRDQGRLQDAPNIDDGAHISESEEDALRQYDSGYLGTAGRAAVTGTAGRPGISPGATWSMTWAAPAARPVEINFVTQDTVEMQSCHWPRRNRAPRNTPSRVKPASGPAAHQRS